MVAILKSAFWYDCDVCGQRNFLEAKDATLADETGELSHELIEGFHLETADEVNGESPYLVFRVAIAPAFVQCNSCSKMHPAEIPSESDD